MQNRTVQGQTESVSKPTDDPYTAADSLLEALYETGVSYLFSNLGSDHPAIIEGMAKAERDGRKAPKIIVSPHETVALAAAHGYWMASGEAQGVFVHCDVGTQNLGGALHNAFRSRVPVFIFAGDTPATIEGEMKGSRNRYINFLQDIYDQRSVVRPYVKWEYEIKTAKNAKQLIYRAMQLAVSDPQGPVYLMGAREVLEEPAIQVSAAQMGYRTLQPSALAPSQAAEIAQALADAKHPLILTSYLGRNKQAVAELVKLCERLSVGVIESNATFMNFPTDHPLHLGFNESNMIEEADVILAIDQDVPWMPSLDRPNADCKIFYLDVDPLKEEIPLWYIPLAQFYKADSFVALMQINGHLDGMSIDLAKRDNRCAKLTDIHKAQRDKWKAAASMENKTHITPQWLTACLNELIDEDTIILNEAITNSGVVSEHLPRTKPGSFFSNGGSSLGWSGGAAIGVKLAQPDKTVVSLTGDGTYYLTVPASVHWVSEKYNAPFLTVIYNNHGWNATKQNLLRIHPEGAAMQNDSYWVSLQSQANMAGIAEAAGGAYAETVREQGQLKEALQNGLNAVKNGRSAVIDVHMEPISGQVY